MQDPSAVPVDLRVPRGMTKSSLASCSDLIGTYIRSAFASRVSNFSIERVRSHRQVSLNPRSPQAGRRSYPNFWCDPEEVSSPVMPLRTRASQHSKPTGNRTRPPPLGWAGLLIGEDPPRGFPNLNSLHAHEVLLPAAPLPCRDRPLLTDGTKSV
jgi:hypothetical protein